MIIVKLVFMTTNSILTNLFNVPETVSVLGPSSHQIMHKAIFKQFCPEEDSHSLTMQLSISFSYLECALIAE